MVYQFPAPVKIGPATRWRLSDLEAFDARAAGEIAPEPRAPQDERYLSVKRVAERYDTSVSTVWRWVNRSLQAEAQ